jgi:xanthine dehydrogenase accessory factor
MKNIYLQIPLNSPEISEMVLATVTGAEGSTPQKPGSSALFTSSGLIAGTVGGGVMEGRVQEIAMKSLKTKTPGYYVFTLDKSASDGEDALCGGKISVLIDPLLEKHRHVFEALGRSSGKRIPGVLMTQVTESPDDGYQLTKYWISEQDKSLIPKELRSVTEPEIIKLLKSQDASGFRELKIPMEGDFPSCLIFLEPVFPAPRLIIAGAGHIGKALSQIGSMLDFEVTVIDDRAEFANHENIPYADHIIQSDIGEALSKLDIGNDSFVVIVTRGHRDDARALLSCIGSDASYIGMIGSRTKVALMQKEFIEKGWATQEQWDKIFAPVGLDIKSKSVEEIAISIAAQLVQVKNNK